MIFEDNFRVSAPRQHVWDFLWDVEKMSRCMPGIERIQMESEDAYSVVVKMKVGFLLASFNLGVKILEAEKPERLRSLFQGKDSKIASGVKLTNTMELISISSAETEVRYKSDITLMGKLATLGRTIIKGKAKQLMRQFSQNLKKEMEGITAEEKDVQEV